MSVVALQTSRMTPAQFAERTVECLGDLDGVVVVNVWKDGTFSVGWSSMSASTLCMAEKSLSVMVSETLAE